LVDMTAVVDAATLVRAPAEVRRARVRGIIYLILAVGTYGLLASGTEGDVIFRLGEVAGDLDWAVSSKGLATFSAAVFGFLGGWEVTRGVGRWSNVALAIALGIFAFAFLGFAAAGKSLSLVGMLDGSVKAATPIAFGALSGVMCERVAVINIGIEGMLLTGAFMGAVMGTIVGPVVGVIGAALAGGVMAAGLAVLAIKYRVDQIIAGVVSRTRPPSTAQACCDRSRSRS
jgi:simple sugar transport system permease protein